MHDYQLLLSWRKLIRSHIRRTVLIDWLIESFFIVAWRLLLLFFDLRCRFGLRCEGFGLELGQVGDLSLHIKVVGQLNAFIWLFDLSLIELDDTYHWLSLDLGVPIDNHIQSILHRTDTLAVKLLHVWQPVLLKINIFWGTNASSLVNDGSILLNGHFKRVSERLITSLLLNACFDNFALVRSEIDKSLRHFTLFEVLALRQLDWHHGEGHRSLWLFCQQEFLVEASGAVNTKHVLNFLLRRDHLLLERFVRVVDHVPVFVAHVGLSNALVFGDGLRGRFVPSFVGKTVEVLCAICCRNHV